MHRKNLQKLTNISDMNEGVLQSQSLLVMFSWSRSEICPCSEGFSWVLLFSPDAYVAVNMEKQWASAAFLTMRNFS